MVVDNISVVQVLNSTYSKDPHLMHLIRMLVFLAAHFDFWFQAQHIDGKANHLAEVLSRNNANLFTSQTHQPWINSQRFLLLLFHSWELSMTATGLGYSKAPYDPRNDK